MTKQGFVYIVSNPRRTVLYIGVTSNLERRLQQHKSRAIDGFSKKYNCTDLVWWQQGDSIVSAIEREKQLKGWTRKRKNELIDKQNPQWTDLCVALFGW